MTIQEGKKGIINSLKEAGYAFEITEDSDKEFIVDASIDIGKDSNPIDVRYIVHENLLISVAYYGDPVTEDNAVDLMKAVTYCNSRWTSTSYFEMDLEEKRVRSVYNIRRDGEGWIPEENRDRFFMNPARMVDLLQSYNNHYPRWMQKRESNSHMRNGIIEKWRNLC